MSPRSVLVTPPIIVKMQKKNEKKKLRPLSEFLDPTLSGCGYSAAGWGAGLSGGGGG